MMGWFVLKLLVLLNTLFIFCGCVSHRSAELQSACLHSLIRLYCRKFTVEMFSISSVCFKSKTSRRPTIFNMRRVISLLHQTLRDYVYTVHIIHYTVYILYTIHIIHYTVYRESPQNRGSMTCQSHCRVFNSLYSYLLLSCENITLFNCTILYC